MSTEKTKQQNERRWYLKPRFVIYCQDCQFKGLTPEAYNQHHCEDYNGEKKN